jgi:biofilm PGA synthesis N-glycosyltransferase PgaC
VYTEAAHSFKELLSQRYRWKYGRSQTFMKHSSVFFSKDENISRRVGWMILPFALIQDILFTLEPFVILYFIYISVRYAEASLFVSALIVLTVYLLANVWSSSHLTIKQRIRLSYFAPPMYFAMYILSAAEYYALIKALLLAPKLQQSIEKKHTTWSSPTRRGSDKIA